MPTTVSAQCAPRRSTNCHRLSSSRSRTQTLLSAINDAGLCVEPAMAHDRRPLGAIPGPGSGPGHFLGSVWCALAPRSPYGAVQLLGVLADQRVIRSPPSSSSWRTDLRSGLAPIPNRGAPLKIDTAVVSTAHNRPLSTDFGEPARF
jgi:hypothetical protein